MKKEKPVLAWHFLPADRKLRYGDGREVRVGQTLAAGGVLALCEHGMHASADILDALGYAPGTVLCRVAVSDGVLRGDNKLVGRSRKCLAMADIRPALVEWAEWCAKRAADVAAAADAAAAAADAAAAYVAAVARTKMQKRCANVVRKHSPNPPVIKKGKP